MRGGSLPPALLFAALGLVLAFAPRRAALFAIGASAAVAIGVAVAPIPGAWREGVFLMCWASLLATAAGVHLPRGVPAAAFIAAAINAGIWAGAVSAVSESPGDLFKAMFGLTIVVPALLLVRLRATVAVKVVSSWLIAVAVLAATLPFLPVTPGYLPDHLE
ncbi:MAG: hypothetical protein JWN66_1185 [Sphingomonas bacterium]|uniref:hypothetical protein n=1 Tax=Sphingomonas bacterium TaxID=1895847 RepID=UPI002614BD9C|nr:hypothetical protein [Sphingomonas bacterium]MDB5704069.1 hypothetical protein [Sphingomonas bacterium]